MRRPAQHHRYGPTRGWAHPYTGVLAAAVFYNDGGQDGAPAGQTPTPADLAGRTPQQPTPPTPPAGPEPLMDKDTGLPMTQARFAKIMARENAKARRKALRELAETAGIPFSASVSDDPDDTEVTNLVQVLKDAQTTRQAQMTEEQRRTEELAAREAEIATREARAQQREAEAAARDRETRIRAALVSLGATGDTLNDAVRLINVPDDADDTAIQAAATELKDRLGVLFGAPAPQTLPPAPSGGPAAGNAPRPAPAGKNAVQEAARARAIQMGLRSDAA